jgi:hypothetical protein
MKYAVYATQQRHVGMIFELPDGKPMGYVRGGTFRLAGQGTPCSTRIWGLVVSAWTEQQWAH